MLFRWEVEWPNKATGSVTVLRLVAVAKLVGGWVLVAQGKQSPHSS